MVKGAALRRPVSGPGHPKCAGPQTAAVLSEWFDHGGSDLVPSRRTTTTASPGYAMPATPSKRFWASALSRLRSTLDALDHDLKAGAFHYRYTDAQGEDGCFLASTFRLIEAWAILVDQDRAVAAYSDALKGLAPGVGIYSEMVDPQTGQYLGNLPQGLTHLAALRAAMAIGGYHPER